MRLHPRRTGALLVVAGMVLLATPVVAAAQTGDTAQIGFYDVTAEATGIGASIGDPSSQPYPLAAGLVPNAVAQAGAGPSGHALASIAWPGPLAGNAGSLANVVGTPLPPEVVSNGNDPVKAEAQAAGGARQEQTVGPMSAVVDGETVEAKTALADFSAPGLVSAARVVTKSRDYTDSGKIVAIAESDLQGVEVAGLLKFDSISTIAKGTTDGNVATTEPTVVVSGVSVAGQKAIIDDKGLHLGGGDQANPLDAGVVAANAALEGMKMKAYLTQPLEQSAKGGSASLNTGAVVVYWVIGGGQQMVAVLGGAAVNLRATSGSALDATGISGLTTDAPSSSPIAAFPVSTPTQSAPGLVPSGSVTPSNLQTPFAVQPTRSARTASKNVAPIANLTPAAAYPQKVAGGWMLIGLLAFGLIGFGLNRLRDKAFAGAVTGSTCPLEEH